MSTTKSSRNDIANTDWNLQAFNNNPDIEENIIQALVRMLGFDSANALWRSLLVDNQGRLLVSTAQVQGNVPTISRAAVPNSETLILSANPNRRGLLIQSVNNPPCNIYFTTGSTWAISLGTGAAYYDDLTLSNVYAKSANANTAFLIVVEY